MAYMSQEGYDQLVAQLKHMEAVERPAASAAIAEARDKGDLSENSEYDAAKEAQALLEGKITKLKMTLASAKIIDTSKLKKDEVQILSTVEMENTLTGAKMKYTIVSESEANLREGKISSTTPIAQGLLGKKVGEVADITIPRGEIHLKITKISYE
jgi:transcription elongation factor GreA